MTTSTQAWPEGPAIATYRQGMKKLLTGVTLVTAAKDGEPSGLVSTNIAQVGGDPPVLIVVINKSASCYAAIKETGAFCVNILSTAQRDLFEQVHLDALVRSGRLTGAQHLLQQRCRAQPESLRLRRQAMALYAQLGLGPVADRFFGA